MRLALLLVNIIVICNFLSIADYYYPLSHPSFQQEPGTERVESDPPDKLRHARIPAQKLQQGRGGPDVQPPSRQDSKCLIKVVATE